MGTTPFPANTAVNSYLDAEKMLVDVLRVVPYCNEHEDVWSPRLVTVLLESCSQLDSLWWQQAKRSPCVEKQRVTIADHFGHYGEAVARKWVVFYAEDPQKFEPFDTWSKASHFRPQDYQKLDWWEAYNKVKHDRLTNRQQASLRHTVRAMAGLFVAIIKCELCHNAMQQAFLVSCSEDYYLQTFLKEDSDSNKLYYVAVESELFTYPVGWCETPICQSDRWGGPSSQRFRDWFDAFSTESKGGNAQ